MVAGQPAFVVGTLALTGALVGAAFALTRPTIVQAYREVAEDRGYRYVTISGATS